MNFTAEKDPHVCPLCGKESGLLQAGLHDDPANNMWLCQPCLLAFQEHLPNPEDLAAYYTEQYRQEGDYLYQDAQAYFLKKQGTVNVRWAHLKDYFGVGQNTLDVGCGAGQFMQRIHDAGGATCGTVAGIEPWKPFAEFARKFGPVLNDTIENAVLPATYDNICLFHVLEHLRYPDQALTKLRMAAAPGGRLFVETPNLQAPLTSHFEYEGRIKQFIKPHLWYFSVQSLSRLLEECGWTVTRTVPHQRIDLFSMLHSLYTITELLEATPEKKVSIKTSPFMSGVFKQLDIQFRTALADKGMTDTILLVCSNAQGD